jgi:predicted type IV restriction endonuclease
MVREEVERVQSQLRDGAFSSENEAAVRQAIVLPILRALGWPDSDTRIVAPEYAVEGRRVDYALCDQPDHPRVFLEVKRVGQTDGGDKQLFEYAFHRGVPIAVLTDGQQWSLFLPGEEGRYEERRVYKLDLLERDASECADRLRRYLACDRVHSGEALEAARSDYRDAARVRQIRLTLPRAWRALVEGREKALLDLLADKVEDLCGYKPEPEACVSFLDSQQEAAGPEARAERLPATQPGRLGLERPRRSPRATAGPVLTFRGRVFQERSARDVMLRLLRLLSGSDQAFLSRFAEQQHGKKRRFVARNRSELYPGRPDLCASAAVEIVPGWWLGTNYSHRDIEKIIRLASEVAGLRFGRDVRIKLS